MDGTDKTNSGQERRRFVRLPIHLEALVALGPRPPIACVVKDFCVAGVFIQIDMRQLRFVQARTPATLHFSLPVNGVVQPLQIGLTVCRVTGTGLGVAFRNPDPQVVGLLYNLAQPEAPRPVPQTANEVTDTQRRFVPEFGRILPKLTEKLEAVFTEIAGDFTRTANDALFLAARDARSNREQTIFIDAQTELRKKTSTIVRDVPALMTKAAAILDNPLRDRTGAAPAAASGLSLVDKDDFEEFLTVSELVAELEGRLKEALFDLNHRVAFLARREVEDRNNPFGPTVVCGAFAEMIKGVSSELVVSGVVYQALRKCLDARLGRLYDEINALLIEQNILPVIEREKFGVRKLGDDGRPTDAPLPLEASKTGGLGSTLSETGRRLSRSQQSIWQNSHARGQRNLGTTRQPGAGLSRTGGQGGSAGPGGGGSLPPMMDFPSPEEYAATTGPRGGGQPGRPTGGFGSGGATGGGSGGMPGGGAPAYGDAYPGATSRGGAPGIGQVPIPPGFVGTPSAGGAAPGGFAGGGGGFGFDATFSGFGYGPAIGNVPSFEQALSIAQNQLALRRQVMPAGAQPTPVDPRRAASRTQLVDGLTELQHSFTATAEPDLMRAEFLKQRVLDALKVRGIETQGIGQTESDAIEIIVNLFQSLLQDSRLNEFAKGNLKRLQGAVHKAALVDEEFLAATQHPLRQLMNRVSLLEPPAGEAGQRLQSRVREMLDGFNLSYNRDPSIAVPLLGELDDYLKAQRVAFEGNVQGVVDSCEEQQRFMRERRERSGEASPPQPTFPAELQRWIARAKAMRVGDRLEMNANPKAPYVATLVWIGDDFNPYVLADGRGNKSASLTLQQVAMYLRRGLVKVITDEGENAVDRALYGVINKLHGQVVEQIAHDELTGLLSRKSFLATIEPLLPQSAQNDPGVVLCQLEIDNLKTINEQTGTAGGDRVIVQITDQLKSGLDAKTVTLGRLGGNQWGIFWSRGGLQSAYREMQTLFEKLDALKAAGETTPAPRLVAGIAAVDFELAHLEPLLAAVQEACTAARTQSDSPIYIAGTDSKQRKQLEQMAAYVAKAVERQRLALLFHEIRSLTKDLKPAAKVLVSAEDRNGKLVPPSLFNQAAFGTPHALDVDLWTLRNTLRWMATHGEDSERFGAFVIPLSRAAIEKDDLSHIVVNELMETAIPPARICFEIEDKVAQAKLAETSDFVNTLREFGCQFMLSEFGGGQANYEYMKELAVSFVSIPSTYIQDARQDAKDLAMAKSINELAHFMGKLTVAKAQGDAAALEMLKDMKIDFVHDTARATRLLLESDDRQS